MRTTTHTMCKTHKGLVVTKIRLDKAWQSAWQARVHPHKLTRARRVEHILPGMCFNTIRDGRLGGTSKMIFPQTSIFVIQTTLFLRRKKKQHRTVLFWPIDSRAPGNFDVPRFSPRVPVHPFAWIILHIPLLATIATTFVKHVFRYAIENNQAEASILHTWFYRLSLFQPPPGTSAEVTLCILISKSDPVTAEAICTSIARTRKEVGVTP